MGMWLVRGLVQKVHIWHGMQHKQRSTVFSASTSDSSTSKLYHINVHVSRRSVCRSAHCFINISFGGFRAVTVKIVVFWFVTPRAVEGKYRHSQVQISRLWEKLAVSPKRATSAHSSHNSTFLLTPTRDPWTSPFSSTVPLPHLHDIPVIPLQGPPFFHFFPLATTGFLFFTLSLLGSHDHSHWKKKLNSLALVRERTIPTERPPLVGEVSANFCG
jgi:hypothetical protein